MTAATVATTSERARAWPRVLAGAAALWVFLDGLILFGTFPYWPRTVARWLLLLVAAPAMVLSLSGLLEHALLPRLRRTPSGSSSGRLAGHVALAAVAVAILAVGAWWTLRVEGP